VAKRRHGALSSFSGVTAADFLGTAVALAVVMLAAYLGGVIARRLGQPAVIGQVAAGFLLGPTVLGAASGDLSARIFSADTTSAARTLGTIGLVAFAFALGAGLDRSRLPSSRRFALVATSVFAVPFVCGAVLALALYDEHRRVDGATIDRLAFVLFVAAAVSITAFPVLARIVDDHDLRDTHVGTLAVSCAAVNDVISWIALAVALLASRGFDGSLEILGVVGAAIALVLALVLLARIAERRELARRRLEQAPRLRQWPLLAVSAGLAASALMTSAIGLHYIFGAFAFGVVVGRPALAKLAEGAIRTAAWVGAILLPLYLVLPGATINLRELDLHAGREILLVLAVAAASKLGAGALSARVAGLSWHDSMSVGLLVNTRGLVELVALGIGSSAGILDTSLYAILVIMAVVTTVATSPGLRLLALRARPH
jgi:Kef-type K+ transport system membrane component KefB